MIKTYQTTVYLFLSTPITIKGKTLRIRFEGGRELPNYTIMGSYKTSDPEIQAALEASPAFNRSFKLASSVEEPSDKPAKAAKVKEPELPEAPLPEETQDNAETTNPDAETENSEPVVAEDVTSGAGAKKFLNETFNVPHSKLANIEIILKVAAEKNVTFPNWNPAK